MNRTYEDMSKEELITLVTRLTKQHDEWSAEAKRLRLIMKNVADFPKKCPPQLKPKGVIDAMVCMLREVIE